MQSYKIMRRQISARVSGWLLGSGLCLFLAARMHSPAAEGSKPLPSPYTVVTTCGMVTDIVREVAGTGATVSGLMGEGVDPHLYKPTRDDVARLLKADVVFYSGLMLEGRMSDTFLKVARKGTPVFAVTELLDEKFLLEPREMQGHTDPHVWMDVQAWMAAVRVVAKSLGDLDRPRSTDYRPGPHTAWPIWKNSTLTPKPQSPAFRRIAGS